MQPSEAQGFDILIHIDGRADGQPFPILEQEEIRGRIIQILQEAGLSYQISEAGIEYPLRPWIRFADRQPTADDATESGGIIVWNTFAGAMMRHRQFTQGSEFFTHWMKCPIGPSGPRQDLEFEQKKGRFEK